VPCKRYKKVAWAKTAPKEGLFTRLRCKQWGCPDCADMNRVMWQKFLMEKLPQIADEWWMITLTAHSDTRTPWSSATNIRIHLDALFKRMRRIWPDFQYARIYEKHPTSQAVHCHIIACGLSPFVQKYLTKKKRPAFRPVWERSGKKGTWTIKTWMKKSAQDLGMGYMADVSPPRDATEHAIFYAVKKITDYTTKQAQDLHVPGLRHVQTSRKIGSPKSEGGLDWTVGSYLSPRSFEAGSRVTDLNTGFMIDNNFWEIHGHYPWDD